MSRLSIKLGYWASVLNIILTVGYGIGVGISFTFFPLPSWTNLADFVAAVRPASLTVFALAQVMAFFLAPLNLILLCSLYDYASDDKKILARIGLCGGIATMVLGTQLYFVHFNSMRVIFTKGMLTGLEQFVEWNTSSTITASGALGWTFFAGVTCICVAFVFSGGRLERALRYSNLMGGVLCGVFGTLGFLLDNIILQTIYLVGGTLGGLITTILWFIFYKRLEKRYLESPTA
jgi:hypothetical protein